jgi:hypothetical protein
MLKALFVGHTHEVAIAYSVAIAHGIATVAKKKVLVSHKLHIKLDDVSYKELT